MQTKQNRTSTWPGLAHRCLPLLALAASAALLFCVNTEWTARLDAHQDKKADARNKKQLRAIPGAGAALHAAALARVIDEEITLRLKQEKLHASGRSDDSEFIRRVTLDLTGVIPTASQVRAFLDSTDPNKREKLIDQLLADSKFGKQLAEIWTTEIITADPDNRQLPVQDLRTWLEDAFNKNKPWNKIVEELITASGDWEENPTTLFFIANNSQDKLTGQVSRLFLGIQLQCAQCHNHPFTDWKQDQYWGMAAFFSRVKQDGTPKKVAKDGGTITISELPAKDNKGGKAAGKAKAKDGKKKKGKGQPEGYKDVSAKFLTGETANVSGSARQALAKWMSAPNNPFFARAMANKMWAHFFGRGIVNPVDDMHDDNPATHPELLLAIAEQFKKHNYDIKYLVKAIVLSETYQRTSKPSGGNEADTEFYSRAYVRTLTPEQLYDSIVAVTGGAGKGGGEGKKGGAAAGKKGKGGTPREQFIRFFRVEEGGDPLEYQDGIPQALRLMNSPLLNNGGKTLDDAARQKTMAEGIQFLYLTVLSRRASAEEVQRRTAYITAQSNTRTGYSDVLWALLNSSEFRLNH